MSGFNRIEVSTFKPECLTRHHATYLHLTQKVNNVSPTMDYTWRPSHTRSPVNLQWSTLIKGIQYSLSQGSMHEESVTYGPLYSPDKVFSVRQLYMNKYCQGPAHHTHLLPTFTLICRHFSGGLFLDCQVGGIRVWCRYVIQYIPISALCLRWDC